MTILNTSAKQPDSVSGKSGACCDEEQTRITEEVRASSSALTTPLINPDVIATNLSLRLRPPADMLLVYIMAEQMPVLMPKETIVFGRLSSSTKGKTFNLSPYDAWVRGVSREHALLNCMSGGCTIEDLGSTNGVWVNGLRLTPCQHYPLSNGDMVQLGQLTLFVYFQ